MTETNEPITSEPTTSETTEARIFTTLEEAKLHKPADKPTWKLFSVTDLAGVTSYTWSGGADTALIRVARKAGWKTSRADQAATKQKVGDLLAKLSPEDRAILIAQYVPAPAPAPASAPASTPEPEKPAGKGKGKSGK